MTIEPLKKQVITAFLQGDRCADGPFRTDGEYLYLNNDAIAYRDNFGGYWKAIQPTATPPPKQPLFNRFIAFFTWPFIASWFGITIIYLIIVNLF